MRGSSALRFSPSPPPSFTAANSALAGREPLNFVNLAKYIQEWSACFIQSQGSECSLTIFAASIYEVISFWAFGSPRIPSASIRFFFFPFPFSFLRPTTRCRFHSATRRGLSEYRVIYPALKIERSSPGFPVNRRCYVTRGESPS